MVWTLVATVVIYFLWLWKDARFQRMFLALGVFSPCLLLHARMARSYSMQLALASLAIYTAPQWADQPRNWKWLLAYIGSNAALLYTHYLSGLAVAAGVCVTFLFKRRFILAATQVALLAILYAPWVPVLASKLPQIGSSYHLRAMRVEALSLIRLSVSLIYSYRSASATHSTVSLLLSFVLAPILIYSLWRAVGNRPRGSRSFNSCSCLLI